MQHAFRGRYKHCTQNVLAAVDFDQKFTYVLAGWEGTAHDALVLRDALTREGGLRVPQGNTRTYVLSINLFIKINGSLRCNLCFNRRHCSLRIIVEQVFGALKRRFKVLDDASPFFSL